ncbi:MAG: type II secretion system F family protein [Deltaproteobacteria bacterium]|nr:type II secretion system F family protein [Deltaproteobacteria bacterium]
MPVYSWEAKLRSGEIRSGEIEAANTDIAAQRIRSQGMMITHIKKKPTQITLRLPGQTGVTTKDIVVFTRQFATMIDAGLPLVQCLDILGTQQPNPDFKKIILDVKAGVESGATLADALRKHPKVFDKLYANLVAAGERSGILDTILNRLAAYMEKNVKLVKQVKGAMIYPVITIIVSVIVTIVLLVFVIPIFQKMFQDFGSELPAPTQLVVDLSEFVRAHIIAILVLMGGTIFALKSALSTPKGREIYDTLLIKAPIIGPLVQRVAVARFTRTLGTMLSSGVPILDALDIVAGTAGNSVIEKGLQVVRARISEGKNMAQPLGEIPVFPPMVVQMIAVGESTGAMDAMLNKIADFYDEEVDAAVANMMAALEPIIMAFLTVIIGGFIISMYLPVFTLAGAVGG